jgi:hypothetical protein
MTKEQTMQTNAARGAAIRATMHAFDEAITNCPPEPPAILTGLRVNGERLAAMLVRMVADQANGDPEGLKTRLAAAMNVQPETLDALLAGKIDFPRREWLDAAALVLGVSPVDLYQASDVDTAAYRQPAVQANARQEYGYVEPPRFLTAPPTRAR